MSLRRHSGAIETQQVQHSLLLVRTPQIPVAHFAYLTETSCGFSGSFGLCLRVWTEPLNTRRRTKDMRSAAEPKARSAPVSDNSGDIRLSISLCVHAALQSGSRISPLFSVVCSNISFINCKN